MCGCRADRPETYTRTHSTEIWAECASLRVSLQTHTHTMGSYRNHKRCQVMFGNDAADADAVRRVINSSDDAVAVESHGQPNTRRIPLWPGVIRLIITRYPRQNCAMTSEPAAKHMPRALHSQRVESLICSMTPILFTSHACCNSSSTRRKPPSAAILYSTLCVRARACRPIRSQHNHCQLRRRRRPR